MPLLHLDRTEVTFTLSTLGKLSFGDTDFAILYVSFDSYCYFASIVITFCVSIIFCGFHVYLLPFRE